MALIKCPECGKEVSDRSQICIQCGFPISEYVREQKNKNILDETINKVEKKSFEEEKNIENDKDACPKCGNPLDKSLKVCMKCGYRERDENEKSFILCPECGGQNRINDDVCIHCHFNFKTGTYEKPKLYTTPKQNNTQPTYTDYSSSVVKNSKPKKKKGACGSILWILIIISMISSCFDNEANEEKKYNNSTSIEHAKNPINQEENIKNNATNTPTPKPTATNTPIPIPTLTMEEKLLKELEKVLDQDVAKNAQDILLNQIQFKNVKFIGQSSVGGSNYDLKADDINIILTASDKVYRIFNQTFVFYDYDAVQMKADDIWETTITDEERTYFYLFAEDIVKSRMKNPNSAKLQSKFDVKMQRKGDIIGVQGYVDAKNSFNATIRSEFLVEFRIIDMLNWSYEVLYIRIDNQEAGTFHELK